MLITFFAMAAGVAILGSKTWLEKAIVFLSAIPIAVAANVIRITVTGFLYESNRNDTARVVFHDLAGWLMMPLGLGMLLLELRILSRLIVPMDGQQSERRYESKPAVV